MVTDQTEEAGWQELLVSKKVLGHISEGLYRTVSGALKELVSNSFDANASRVIVTTNRPSFDLLSCSDDGDGMTIAEFQALMQGGIGDSFKRAGPRVSTTGRHIIGRIGIGILGIAQVCHSFRIVSHHGQTRTAFEAEVVLSPKVTQNLDTKTLSEEEDSTDAAQEIGVPTRKREYVVGKFSYQAIPYEQRLAGFTIATNDLREGYIRKMSVGPRKSRDSDERIPPPPLPRDFSVLYKQILDQGDLREAGEYRQMVWGLGLACPVPYIEGGPVVGQKVAQEHVNRLASYGFEVIVDGCALRKPILLPSPAPPKQDKDVPVQIPFEDRAWAISWDKVIFGDRLKLSGYIYSQDGRSIRPPELRGLLIRVRDVAIGTHDRSCLGYPYVEGPRIDWLTGEIYVDEGLEDTLNVDRNSFNTLHPHYEALQQTITEILHKHVFPDLYRKIDKRSRARNESRLISLDKELPELVERATGLKYSVRKIRAEKAAPVRIDKNAQTIVLNEQWSGWPKKPEARSRMQRVVIAYEIAELEASSELSHDKFFDLVRKMLKS